MDEESAKALANVLHVAKMYARGDAFAGVKLDEIGNEHYSSITKLLQNIGVEGEFNNQTELVGFVTDPNTSDDKLNNIIEDL